MERKISWESYVFDEMQLVYEKAEKDDAVGAMLADLESMALREAEERCGLLLVNGNPVTKDMFLAMSDSDKEVIIYNLSRIGLQSVNGSLAEPIITVSLSSQVQLVLGCTMFNLLNRLEKLDGSFNIRHPEATLRLLVPLGGKKGLAKCEMLIMALYPWISVSEGSSNMIADTPQKAEETIPGSGTKPDKEDMDKKTDSKPEKKSLWARLFGK